MKAERMRGGSEKPEISPEFTEEEKNQVQELLNDPKIRKELMTRKSAPYTEAQLVQAENYLAGKDLSKEAHHQFGRLSLEAQLLTYQSEDQNYYSHHSYDGARSVPPKSARKPSLDDYDRMMR